MTYTSPTTSVTTATKYYQGFGRSLAMRRSLTTGLPEPVSHCDNLTDDDGDGLADDGCLRYLLADHLGSTTGVLGTDGTLLATHRYWPYGSTRTTTGTPQTDKLYTGQQQEAGDSALGLYNYKARFYSTTLGRFVSVDPIAGGNPSYPQSLNAYSYGLNNPLVHTDPSGECNPGIDCPQDIQGLKALADVGFCLKCYELHELYVASTFLTLNGCVDIEACWNTLAQFEDPSAYFDWGGVDGVWWADEILAAAATLGIDLVGRVAGRVASEVFGLGARTGERLVARWLAESASSSILREAQRAGFGEITDATLIRAGAALARSSRRSEALRIQGLRTGGWEAAQAYFTRLTGQTPQAGEISVSGGVGDRLRVILRPSESGPPTVEIVDRVKAIIVEVRFQ